MAEEGDRPFVIDCGTGVPVVLVHGQPGVAGDWRPVVDRLATITDPPLRTLVPDRPGWGSSPDTPTGVKGNADWLEQALSSLVGDEPVVVAGHSFGGGVAIRLALDHPERARALVLVSPIGRDEALSRLDRVLAHPQVGERIVRGGLFAARRVARVVRRRFEQSERHAGAAQAALVLQLAGEKPFSDASVHSFLVEQRALVNETPDLARALPSLRVPAVVLAGAGDRIVSAAASRALAASIPGAELVTIQGAGHLLPFEAPEVVAATIARYVRLTG